MVFAISLILSFFVLGLFIYKSELFHNSKDSPKQYKYHSEEKENDIEESYTDSEVFKTNESLDVNLEIEESIEKKRWKLKQQLNALNYLSQMELMDFNEENAFEDNANQNKLIKRTLRKRITELSSHIKKHNSKKQADKTIE